MVSSRKSREKTLVSGFQKPSFSANPSPRNLNPDPDPNPSALSAPSCSKEIIPISRRPISGATQGQPLPPLHLSIVERRSAPPSSPLCHSPL